MEHSLSGRSLESMVFVAAFSSDGGSTAADGSGTLDVKTKTSSEKGCSSQLSPHLSLVLLP